MKRNTNARIGKRVLAALLFLAAFGATNVQAAGFKCRIQHCFYDIPWLCYYDSGWIDC